MGTWVPSLVGELRPHMICGDTKKKKKWEPAEEQSDPRCFLGVETQAFAGELGGVRGPERT